MRDYQEECSVVLLFTHGKDCPACKAMLTSFAGRQGEYRTNDATILAIVPEPVEEISGDRILRDLPFEVLVDDGGRVRRQYTGLMDESLTKEEDSLLFVLDSYAAPYAALIGPELVKQGIPATGEGTSQSRDDELHDQTIKWLEYISIQCPE